VPTYCGCIQTLNPGHWLNDKVIHYFLMVGSRFADKYFTRMLLMKILLFSRCSQYVMKNSVRRKRGDGETIFFKVFSLPSFISWRIQIPKRETLVKESNDNFEEGSALADDLNNDRFSFSNYKTSSLRLRYAFSPCHELAVSLHGLGYPHCGHFQSQTLTNFQ